MFLRIGMDTTQEELDLHYDLNTEKFAYIKTDEQISNWFDKIIKYNKEANCFDEKCIIKKKEQLLEKYKKVKNRLFRIKIGDYNLCLSKKLRIYIEVRD